MQYFYSNSYTYLNLICFYYSFSCCYLQTINFFNIKWVLKCSNAIAFIPCEEFIVKLNSQLLCNKDIVTKIFVA